MTLVAVLHIAGAVFVVGPLVLLPMLALRYLRQGDWAATGHIATLVTALNYASLAIAALGFGLVAVSDSDDGFTYTTPWIMAASAIYLVAFGLTAFVVVPAFRAAVTAGRLDRYPLLAAISGITAILYIAVVVLMVWKP